MNRLRTLLVCLLALATASVGLVAAQRAQAAVQTIVVVSAAKHAVAEAGHADHQARAAVSAKRCLRGALPGAPCGVDLAPPVRDILPADPVPARLAALRAAGASLKGLPPSCVPGPPRSC